MDKIVYKTLRQKVVETLRMKILNGELKPGERLVEQELSEILGVSRGPIREALRQLEQEGLLEYARNVGCTVRSFTDIDTYEVYLIRGTLEVLAAKLCNGKLSEENKCQMQQILSKMADINNPDFFNDSVEYDNEFHSLILEQTALPRLIRLWKSISITNTVIFYSGNTDLEKAAKRQYDIHKVLLDAYLTQDINIIDKQLREHYMLTTKRHLKEMGLSESDFPYHLI